MASSLATITEKLLRFTRELVDEHGDGGPFVREPWPSDHDALLPRFLHHPFTITCTSYSRQDSFKALYVNWIVHTSKMSFINHFL